MTIPFREYHLFQILAWLEQQTLPLDAFLRNYFREHKAVGSKDRKIICEHLYALIRWKGLLDYLCSDRPTTEQRYRALLSPAFERAKGDLAIPPHIRLSFPKSFYDLLVTSLGEVKALAFCKTSNEQAPTTVRVNLLKTTREALLKQWKGRYEVSACTHSEAGIRFERKINFFDTDEFKQGLFEIQDEASQLIANLIAIRPGERFLDYCAGSGGKALSVATKLVHKGELLLHDIRPHALAEAKKRLRRAHIQNAQIVLPNSGNKKRLRGKMDWVLVDAPCSGTGTLRRNPDMKWKFQEEALERLVLTQRAIFEEALQDVKPGGHIVYATCSVLPQENEAQAAQFLEKFPLEQEGSFFSSFPTPGGMDGFFGVVFKKMKA